MFGADRRQAVLELLRMRGSVTIAELARAVDVSEVTVRRDVDTLAKRGLLVRGHGGVMLPDAVPSGLLGGEGGPRRAVFGAERRRVIAHLVRSNRAVSLADLCGAMAVSEMTVRRDLDILERRGVLVRERGGALALGTDPIAAPRSQEGTATTAQEAMDAIGAMAATLALDASPIMLGGGRTVYALARRLRPERPTTVLTTSVPVARALAETPNVSLVVAAGALEGQTQSLVGSAAERWVASHRVRRAFLSGAGLTAGRGLSAGSLAVSGISRAIIDSADETVVLADSRKLGVDTTYPVAPVRALHHLVVDEAPDDLVSPFAELGVRVHRALLGLSPVAT